jgi:hypothetical protein
MSLSTFGSSTNTTRRITITWPMQVECPLPEQATLNACDSPHRCCVHVHYNPTAHAQDCSLNGHCHCGRRRPIARRDRRSVAKSAAAPST